MKIAAALLAALLTAHLLCAQVTVEALDEREKTALHVFGGETAKFDVAMEAPLGAKVSLAVALFQIANGGLAAPLGEQSAGDPVDFEKQTHRVISVAIALPSVKHRTELLARFVTQVAGAGEKSVAGSAKLFVYPRDQMKEFAASLDRAEKDTGLSLGVFGESKRLRAFLKECGIHFSDAGSELPAALKETSLYLGEVDARSATARRLPGSRVVFFSADPALLPGIYTTISESGLFTKVTLPLLDTLATNPQSQRAFIDILRHSLDASAITSADTP